MRSPATAILALALGSPLALAACHDDPAAPTTHAPAGPVYSTTAAVESCQTLFDPGSSPRGRPAGPAGSPRGRRGPGPLAHPDRLCDAPDLVERLCVLLVDGGVADVVLERPRRRYTVVFDPQPDGGVTVSVTEIRPNDSEGATVTWTLDAERVVEYRQASCTDMVFRTIWDADGAETVREHRAVEGLARPLDVDGLAGADVTADIDRAGASVTLVLERAPEAASQGELTIEAMRDPGSGDDRAVTLRASPLPERVTFELDDAERRVAGSTSSPVGLLVAAIDAGSGDVAGAPLVQARLLSVDGAFALAYASGAEFTAGNEVGVAEMRVQRAGDGTVLLPPSRTGILRFGDATGASVALRTERARRLAWSHPPFLLEFDGAATRDFVLQVREPGVEASAQVSVLPGGAVLSITGRAAATEPGPDIALVARSAFNRVDVSLRDDVVLGGGALDISLVDAPRLIRLTLDATGPSTEPVRFAFQTLAPVRGLAVSLTDLFGAYGGRMALSDVPAALAGCITADGSCP